MLSVLCNLPIFKISMLIRNASAGMKDEPESQSVMFTYSNNEAPCSKNNGIVKWMESEMWQVFWILEKAF